MAEKSAGSPPAVGAFLRGVERRAGLLSSLQCGDETAGDLALSAAMRAFSRQAGEQLLADWPLRFWRLLAAVPGLRQDRPPGGPNTPWADAPLSHLAGLRAGDRLALLLRLVAGLDEEQAAQALGIDVQAYQQALAAACPRLPDGQADAPAWRRLAETLQQQLRDLPPTRLARLAQLREGALAGPTIERRPAPVASRKQHPRVPSNTSSGRRRRGLAAAVVLLTCAGALVATYYWAPRQAPALAPGPALTGTWQNGTAALAPTPVIEVEPLPPAEQPGPVTPVQSGSHADAELLMAPDRALAQEADFLAWYLATHGEDVAATRMREHANATR